MIGSLTRYTKNIPKLRLYTGGKECSLCEDAKAAIESVRKNHKFDLDYYNIKDDSLKDVKYWRKLYQYDIPVLHLDEEEIMRHRINVDKLSSILKDN